MRRYLVYLRYLALHKWYVFRAGLIVGGIPIRTLLIHDWSKFTPAEFFPYARHFYNPDGSKRTKKGAHLEGTSDAFETSWVRHQHRNLHHWQAWVSISDYGVLKPVPMPPRYLREMVADWIGAGWAISGDRKDFIDWYEKNKHKIVLHDFSRKIAEAIMHRISVQFQGDVAQLV